MKILRFIMLLLIISFQFFSQASVRLIGIYNNLTSPTAHVSVRGTIYTEVKSVRGMGAKYPTSMSLTIPKEPGGLLIDVKDYASDKTYTIKLYESQDIGYCSGRSTRVVAQIIGEEGKSGSKKVTCISAAIDSMPGRNMYDWQSVLVAIGDHDPRKLGEYFFDFGLAAWTSTTFPWNKPEIEHTAAEYDADTKARNAGQSYTWKMTFDPALRVIQGLPAWGGGDNPRWAHSSIVNFYNNTSYNIAIARSSTDTKLSQYNFEMLIPPHCATPFAMAWIPKVPADQVFTPMKSEIQIYALKAAEKADDVPPPAFVDTSKVGPEEQPPSPVDPDKITDAIAEHTSQDVFDILGQSSIEDITISRFGKYFITQDRYRLFLATDANKTIYIQKCPTWKEEEAVTISTATAGYESDGTPGYFKLIISQDLVNGGIKFDLAKTSFDAVQAY